MNICVIPARGGSKRIPKKNIKNFCGKPIIVWSIEEAIQSGCFDKTIVSTDNNEIADLAKKHGAEVPFIRPKEISDDYTQTITVITHAIRHQIMNDIKPNNVCCLYATAPFVRSDSLKLGIEKLSDSSISFTFSATRYHFPIQRAFRITENKRLQMFQPKHHNSRSQDLEDAYHDAGQFYCGTTDTWLNSNSLINKKSYPLLIPSYRVQDIDTLEDWQRAELMFYHINKNKL